MKELWKLFCEIFRPRISVVKFTGGESQAEMNERMKEWRKTIPPAPKERPVAGVTRYLGPDYAGNLKQQADN